MANGVLMGGSPIGALDTNFMQSPRGEPEDAYREVADVLRVQVAESQSEIDRIKGDKLGGLFRAIGAFGAGIQGKDPSRYSMQAALQPWQDINRQAQQGIAQTSLQRAMQDQRLRAQATQGDPSAVREYQYWAGLSPRDQEDYMRVKRSTIEKVGNQLFETSGTSPQELLTRDQLQALAEQQGLEVREKKTAESEVKAEQEASERLRSDTAALTLYETAVGGLEEALSGTITGPVAGRLPAVTSEAQIAEGAVAAMAPILKTLFRTSGEGTFTDKDQELLTSMLPTRQDTPEAAQAKLDNVDKIVRAKLAGSRESVESLRGVGITGGSATKVLRYNPQTGRLE